MWKRICQVGSLALVQDNRYVQAFNCPELLSLSGTLVPKCGPLPTLAMIGEPADSHMTKTL